MKSATALLLLLMAAPAYAGEVGRTEFNSRTVILNDDQTWEYAETLVDGGSDCTAVASNVVPVELCLPDDAWRPTNLGEEFEKAFTSGSGVYLGLITEHLFVDRPTMKKVIVENAEAGAGPGGVKNLVQVSRTINGMDWLHSSFSFDYGTVEIHMENFMYSREGFGTAQIAIWGAAQSEEQLQEAAEMVAANLMVAGEANPAQ